VPRLDLHDRVANRDEEICRRSVGAERPPIEFGNAVEQAAGQKERPERRRAKRRRPEHHELVVVEYLTEVLHESNERGPRNALARIHEVRGGVAGAGGELLQRDLPRSHGVRARNERSHPHLSVAELVRHGHRTRRYLWRPRLVPFRARVRAAFLPVSACFARPVRPAPRAVFPVCSDDSLFFPFALRATDRRGSASRVATARSVFVPPPSSLRLTRSGFLLA
jgi:hypothetical protein